MLNVFETTVITFVVNCTTWFQEFKQKKRKLLFANMSDFCKISTVQCGASGVDDCFHHSVFPQSFGEVTQTKSRLFSGMTPAERQKKKKET